MRTENHNTLLMIGLTVILMHFMLDAAGATWLDLWNLSKDIFWDTIGRLG